MPGERFIDTNVFIRHLTGDHPTQSPAATALIARIEGGHEKCWTSDVTVAECIWVLTGAVYRVPRSVAAESLSPVLSLDGLRLSAKRAMVQALEIYASTNLSFVDAYEAACVLNSEGGEMYSWDRGFDRVPGITRIRPPG